MLTKNSFKGKMRIFSLAVLPGLTKALAEKTTKEKKQNEKEYLPKERYSKRQQLKIDNGKRRSYYPLQTVQVLKMEKKTTGLHIN